MNKKTPIDSSTPRLITIALSHYCEKARWALDWLKIPYIEESHIPLIHRFYTRPHGGRSVPVLITQTGAFVDSKDIISILLLQQTENFTQGIRNYAKK
jgi:glutathione S-transferase